VFLDLVPSAIGYDIDPKDTRIQKIDFLTVDIPKGCVVFGNPPFGRQSSMAKKFIKHACGKADWIGFILPRSFQKPSMQKAFPLCFHLNQSLTLPTNAFIVNDQPYDVPCIFQIWKREATLRVCEPTLDQIGFDFVKKSDGYTLAFRRVGGNAGQCSDPGNHSEQSHYFIRLDDPTKKDKVIEESRTHIFPTNTTGPRSLSRNEASQFLNRILANATT
jgi:hypothetical protein